MQKNSLLILLLIVTTFTNAQRVALPLFTKWHTNNAPDCKNVVLTKDSIVLPVKNKCRSEGLLANWRPMVDISEGLPVVVPAYAKIQLTITYKFSPQGNDVFSFNGSFDPISDNSDESASRYLQLPAGEEKILPSPNGYTKAILLVNFSNEISNPVWKSSKALKGEMNFGFNVTNSSGETHQGSKAIIKEVKLEVIK